MEALLRAHRPRLYVTVSVLHNPTGGSLAPAVAHQLLRLADQHDLTDRRRRHLRLAGAAARHAAGAAGRAAAHGLRLGLLQDPDAAVARGLHRRRARAGAALHRHQAAGHADHAAAAGRRGGLCLDQGALRRHAERVIGQLDAARAHGAPGARRRLPLRVAAAGAVRLGRRRPGHRPRWRSGCWTRLPDRPGLAVPRPPTADHADARELRRRPGRPLLAPVASA
jgi:hypothetical protein